MMFAFTLLCPMDMMMYVMSIKIFPEKISLSSALQPIQRGRNGTFFLMTKEIPTNANFVDDFPPYNA
jgi:hypothetical protein